MAIEALNNEVNRNYNIEDNDWRNAVLNCVKESANDAEGGILEYLKAWHAHTAATEGYNTTQLIDLVNAVAGTPFQGCTRKLLRNMGYQATNKTTKKDAGIKRDPTFSNDIKDMSFQEFMVNSKGEIVSSLMEVGNPSKEGKTEQEKAFGKVNNIFGRDSKGENKFSPLNMFEGDTTEYEKKFLEKWEEMRDAFAQIMMEREMREAADKAARKWS